MQRGTGVCRIYVYEIRGLVASSLASIGVYTSTLISGHRTKTLLLGRSYGPSEDGMTISNHYTNYYHLQTEVEPLTGGVELSSTKLQLSNLQVSLVEGGSGRIGSCGLQADGCTILRSIPDERTDGREPIKVAASGCNVALSACRIRYNSICISCNNLAYSQCLSRDRS
jgi:hypothetical protein